MIPSDTLLYSQIDAEPSCHQRGFTQQLMQGPTAKHQVHLRKSYRIWGEEQLWEPERPTLPCKNIKGTTDLGSWEHMKTESPTRDPLWDWSGPSEQVLQLCGFVFLWDSWQREWGLPLTLLPGSCILFLLTSFSLLKEELCRLADIHRRTPLF